MKQEREKLSENNFLKDIPGDQVEEIFKAKTIYSIKNYFLLVQMFVN